MRLELHQSVTVTRDLPAQGLKQGQAATLIDYALHEEGGELGDIVVSD